MTAPASEHRRQSPARRRVLDTAAALFYAEGLHTVGIDRIIAQAGVAKATFYHHFPAKDELVRAYLDEEYQRQRAAIEAMRTASIEPRQILLAIFEYLGKTGASAGFRGCPFTNAAAEYPDPAHPVRRTIAEYRRWSHTLFRDLLADAGDPDPERTATILMMLRDGIVVGSDLDDPNALRPVIRDALIRVLDGQTPPT
ncbi:MAG TPA: TetR/AcrR family transcriptional regulator [Actinophytocola sp.]|uniref:TetR/AcrR family transcriptional regulator n=1 Tax=Actinophytocola sp. TaxID=1872138 RepID=UPI002DDDA267|nr:TetR/AcrR family transcriptional regulator [Actinophytocola sp.]HEV2782581.1 TetR/AcrR family transcriptional regulator [Actinophytocola sp.]